MNFNNNPYEQWTNLKTADPVDYKDYDGLFNFCKATSNYHFDETIDDTDPTANPPVIIPICNFQGNWDNEINQMSAIAEPATFDYRSDVRQDNNNNLEYQDFKKWGYKVDAEDENPYVLLDRVRHTDMPVIFQKIVDVFKMTHPNGRRPDANVKFDVQRPGQLFYWHLDNFGGLLKNLRKDYTEFAPCDYDQRKLMRLIVMLEDQKIGQTWRQGNTYITWKKGDCFTWPWRDIPHGTANFSHYDRPTLNITGTVTPGTLEFLKTCPRVINL